MTWSASEVEHILELMRAGASVQTGGSRCHTSYFFDGEWGYEDFDEGATQRGTTSEAVIRSLIEREPELFRAVLRAEPWRRFSAAFVAGQREAARDWLRAALVYGDPHRHGEILDAVLAWPEQAPDERVLARIRDELRGSTAWHVFMGAVGWDRSAESGARGLAFCDTLAQMLGAPPHAIGWHHLRANFHELRDDFASARRELELELASLPEGHGNAAYVEQQLMRVRARCA